MIRLAMLFATLAVVASALPAGAGERLLYQIEEHAAGTRSQGWRGTLYDETGAAMELAPGQRVRTPAGIFVGVACTMPWRPCGAILQDMLLPPPHDDLARNDVMVSVWSYRITIIAPGSKSEGSRGELTRDSQVVQPDGDRIVATPMGGLVWVENPNLWGAHGWFPR